MAYKNGSLYWYKFVWQGRVIRESTHVGNKRDAEQIEAAARKRLGCGPKRAALPGRLHTGPGHKIQYGPCECGAPALYRGMCPRCYRRWWRRQRGLVRPVACPRCGSLNTVRRKRIGGCKRIECLACGRRSQRIERGGAKGG